MVLAGCSGSKADDGGAAAVTTEDTSKEQAVAEDGTGGSPPTTAKSAKESGSSSQKSSTPTTVKPGGGIAVNPGGGARVDAEDPYKKTLDITAELAESCVRPGGSQSITIRTEPYAGVGYDTMYSDYLTGMMEGHYGGNSAGFTDGDGIYKDTWVITPNAPAGEAIVLVLGSHDEGGMGETKATYKVADALGKCS
jgi:hypothetical protein